MNLREKYGEWGIILGATEGVGKAFAEKIASDLTWIIHSDSKTGLKSLVYNQTLFLYELADCILDSVCP